LDLALEPDRQRLAATVERLARRDPDPALADAVLLDIAALHALEADADAAVERGLVVMRAARVVGQAVGRGVGFGHGMRARRDACRRRVRSIVAEACRPPRARDTQAVRAWTVRWMCGGCAGHGASPRPCAFAR